MEENKVKEELETVTEESEHEHHHHHHDHDGEHEHHHHHDHEHEGHEHHHHHDHDEEHEHHHHHDHDEEHEHHHHHEHGEECSCGHDHEHDHDHEHHHHDHGHQYEIAGFKVFETHNHEGATICSFEKSVAAPAADVVNSMKDAINTLKQWLDETDATIGHVKGYVKEAGPITTFSTVGYDLNVDTHDSNTVAVGFASIVFGPSEEELKDKVAEIFAAV